MNSLHVELLNIECLASAIKEQQAKWEIPFTRRQRNNLAYAVDTIKPQTHQEYAFAVWIGSIDDNNIRKWVDEYVLRRNGKPSLLLDHPAFELDDWCMPLTYRIPAFKEQFYTLLNKMTNHSYCTQQINEYLLEICDKNYPDGIDTGEQYLYSLVDDDLKEQIPSDDIEVITRLIEELHFISYPYAYCSTIVERAFRKQIKQMARRKNLVN